MGLPAVPERTIALAQKFLDALREGLSVGGAAEAAGVSRQTANAWRDGDPDFAAEWDLAVEQGTDRLEDAARDRGIEGIEKKIFYHGREIATVREYSDALLALLLRGRRPEKFGSKSAASAPPDAEAVPKAEVDDLEVARRITYLLDKAREPEAALDAEAQTK